MTTYINYMLSSRGEGATTLTTTDTTALPVTWLYRVYSLDCCCPFPYLLNSSIALVEVGMVASGQERKWN